MPGRYRCPTGPKLEGLSASDLRWRCYLDTPPYILSAGADIGADGLLGRKTVGKGVAIFCQVDPDGFNADQKTYFRYTRWRATRAVAQLLANLGASFAVDSRFFQPLEPVVNPDRMWIGPDGDRRGMTALRPSSRLLDLPPTPARERQGRLLLSRLSHGFPDGRQSLPLLPVVRDGLEKFLPCNWRFDCRRGNAAALSR